MVQLAPHIKPLQIGSLIIRAPKPPPGLWPARVLVDMGGVETVAASSLHLQESRTLPALSSLHPTPSNLSFSLPSSPPLPPQPHPNSFAIFPAPLTLSISPYPSLLLHLFFPSCPQRLPISPLFPSSKSFQSPPLFIQSPNITTSSTNSYPNLQFPLPTFK